MPQAILSNWWALALFGLFVGVFAGVFGLGGGAVIVPLLVLGFGFLQREAQGTSLAVILSPTAAPAIWRYHQGGYVDWKFVAWVAPFMLLGSYFGAWIATSLPQALMKVLFAFVVIYIGGYMVFGGGSPARAVVLSAIPALVTVVLALATGAFTQAVKKPASAATTVPAATAPADAAPGGGAPTAPPSP